MIQAIRDEQGYTGLFQKECRRQNFVGNITQIKQSSSQHTNEVRNIVHVYQS